MPDKHQGRQPQPPGHPYAGAHFEEDPPGHRLIEDLGEGELGLQFFLSESRWDPERMNDRRLELLLLGDPATALGAALSVVRLRD